MAGSLIAFIAAAGLLTITPGLDTALVLRTMAVEGSRRAFAAAMGICLGLLVWGAVVALGLGVLIHASRLAFDLIKWAGAAYLCYLGIQLILSGRRELVCPDALQRGDSALWLRRGLLTNLLNPKVGVFYISFLPQFIPAGTDVRNMTLLLAGLHAMIGLGWFAILIMAGAPLVRTLRNARTLRILDRTTGLLLVIFGARLAFGRS